MTLFGLAARHCAGGRPDLGRLDNGHLQLALGIFDQRARRYRSARRMLRRRFAILHYFVAERTELRKQPFHFDAIGLSLLGHRHGLVGSLSLVTIISIYREGGILKRLRATPLRRKRLNRASDRQADTHRLYAVLDGAGGQAILPGVMCKLHHSDLLLRCAY